MPNKRIVHYMLDSLRVNCIYPPSGWKYGFPKPAPPAGTDIKNWLIEQGYPANRAEWASQNCRLCVEGIASEDSGTG